MWKTNERWYEHGLVSGEASERESGDGRRRQGDDVRVRCVNEGVVFLRSVWPAKIGATVGSGREDLGASR